MHNSPIFHGLHAILCKIERLTTILWKLGNMCTLRQRKGRIYTIRRLKGFDELSVLCISATICRVYTMTLWQTL